MCTKILIPFLSALIFPLLINAQSNEDERILFEVEGQPVTVSEFSYIYTKTNGKGATFSRPSIEEYLDLYIKFKLKVMKAREMKLDTIVSLQRELAGYRRQLSNSYLVDKRVTRVLAQEVYDRMQRDIDISHILVATQPGMPNDTVAAWERSMRIQERLEAGESFEQVASELSEDKTTRKNGGRIGYLTAMFPDGFYDLETAAYSLAQDGTWTGPVRTKAGYHFVKLNESRPARGEMDISHILIRTSDERDEAQAKVIADSLYGLLSGGMPFEEIAKANSEDKVTAARGGYLGYFGINRYETAFEDAAFALSDDGTFTEPVKTSLGWHIIKRNRKKELQSFEQMLPAINPQLLRDSRHKAAEEAMVESIKQEAGFSLQEEVLALFLDSVAASDQFLTHRWTIPNFSSPYTTLFSLDKGYTHSLLDFAQHCKRSTRIRLRGTRNSAQEIALEIFNDFVKEKVLKYEEKQLEQKYPDFKSLMREYEEGILLFEASKRLVWDKASEDTIGLQEFFESRRSAYQWNERARVTEYLVSPDAASMITDIQEFASKKPSEKVLDKYNQNGKEVISFQESLYEKGKESKLIGIPFESGAFSKPQSRNPGSQALTFFKIEEILPAQPKELDEARGFVVADYQDYLESSWVKALKSKYEVVVNKQILESLISK
ncbi:MAG: peptidylprolyl isomerase [Saprospiraceae bacterium]